MTNELAASAPSLRYAFGETGLFGRWFQARLRENQIASSYPGDGRPVMVLPGMFTSDRRTTMLRRVLDKAGYVAFGWELGHNWPGRTDTLERVIDRAELIAGLTGRPVTLIGWSLGGLYAREAARRTPSAISAVITLGSPFSGDPRSNRAWRAYELTARHRIEQSPFYGQLSEKPPVPTVAIWSGQDGVVSPESARGLDGERDYDVQVSGGHLALASSTPPLRAILRVLRDLPPA